MFDYKGNLRRLKLFKELEPDFKKQFKTAPFGASLNLYKGEQND